MFVAGFFFGVGITICILLFVISRKKKKEKLKSVVKENTDKTQVD